MLWGWRAFGMATIIFLVSACSHADKPASPSAEEKASEPKIEPKPVATAKTSRLCPQVAIIRSRESTRDYGQEKADPSELVAAARMESVTGDCRYHDNIVDVNFTLSMLVERGPRLGGDHSSFTYFVAVLDTNDDVIAKNTLTADVTVPVQSKGAVHKEPLHVRFAVPADQLGQNYRVLMGF